MGAADVSLWMGPWGPGARGGAVECDWAREVSADLDDHMKGAAGCVSCGVMIRDGRAMGPVGEAEPDPVAPPPHSCPGPKGHKGIRRYHYRPGRGQSEGPGT